MLTDRVEVIEVEPNQKQWFQSTLNAAVVNRDSEYSYDAYVNISVDMKLFVLVMLWGP